MDQTTQAPVIRVLGAADILRMEPPAPLVDGLLYERTASTLWGQRGAGKSFLALDWALHVATNKSWFGRTVAPGRVVYVIGEGLGFFRKRLEAWMDAHKRREED